MIHIWETVVKAFTLCEGSSWCFTISKHYLQLNYDGIPMASYIIFILKSNELIVINVTTVNAKEINSDYLLIVKGG